MTNAVSPEDKTKRLQDLIHRKDKVLAVMHPPSASHVRLMEEAGCEAAFVGTSAVVGSYTGLGDVGTATITECVQIAGWIANNCSIPIMVDGDTGHGGIMAVRRLVRECIKAGLAGVRIDDQPIEGKRTTQSAGLEVVPMEQALVRYRAAVDMKNELDPNFVIMAQCYARDAANSSFEDCMARLVAYQEVAGVDWVQLESPHSLDEVKEARARLKGPFSFMKGRLPRTLGLKEHLDIGVTIAWYPGFTHSVMRAALWDFLNDFQDREIAAWEDFQASRKGKKPVPPMGTGPNDEGLEKQRELEERYLGSEAIEKYKRAQGGTL